MPPDVLLLRAGPPPAAPDPEVRRLLQALPLPPAGARVLVKPNLVAPRNPGLSCTDPEFVRSVCVALLDLGLRLTVADSPAFGTASQVARNAGLDQPQAFNAAGFLLPDPLEPIVFKPLRLVRGRIKSLPGR